jgi:heme A synthase
MPPDRPQFRELDLTPPPGAAPSSGSRNTSAAARFAWATLGWNVAVVLWGAYVRATGSGAGCGNHWPDCNGQVLGASAKSQTIIEFTHRMTSGIAFLMVIGLLIWCWRVTSKGNWARYSAVLAAVLMTNEALLGAALVLLDYVSQNKSAGRIVVLCLHFGNTLLLLASLSLTAAWLSKSGGFKWVRSGRQAVAIGSGLLATMAIGITGAMAALADTLFPATSLRASLLQDFSGNAPPLLHFRMLHPMVAFVSACYVGWVIVALSVQQRHFPRKAILLIVLLVAQIAIGATNVLLLAPVWLQIFHLLVADVLWITLVLTSADLMLEPSHVFQKLELPIARM